MCSLHTAKTDSSRAVKTRKLLIVQFGEKSIFPYISLLDIVAIYDLTTHARLPFCPKFLLMINIDFQNNNREKVSTWVSNTTCKVIKLISILLRNGFINFCYISVYGFLIFRPMCYAWFDILSAYPHGSYCVKVGHCSFVCDDGTHSFPPSYLGRVTSRLFGPVWS